MASLGEGRRVVDTHLARYTCLYVHTMRENVLCACICLHLHHGSVHVQCSTHDCQLCRRGGYVGDDQTEAMHCMCIFTVVSERSIGFTGHFLDQKRLKQGLYRHPTEDISYIGGEL